MPLALALFAAGAALAQQPGTPAYERQEAVVHRAEAGRALGQALFNNHGQVVTGALRVRGRDEATLATLAEVRVVPGRDGVTHRRYEQTLDGLPVYGAYAKAAFRANGELIHLIDHLAGVSPQPMRAARTDARQAVETAMRHVHAGVSAQFRSLGRNGNTERFDGGAFFHNAPEASAVAIPQSDGTVARGWLVQLWTQKKNLLDHVLVGGDGAVLHVERRTASDSYNVFVDDPLRGAQTFVAGPGAGNALSPAGWLGAGTQTTVNIQGNNTRTYLDTDANNAADAGGTAVTSGNFLAAVDLLQSPKTPGNRAGAVQNLFYLTNRIHDILYGLGFDEVAGNFQVNNFGKGGLGNDPVLAEAQDGSGTDNANFATPADGSSPRMQMYLWTGAGATHEVVVGASNYGAMGASFGPALTTTGLTGALALATPAEACSAVSNTVSGKVAIVDRGTCNFTDKVMNAQKAGAIGVVLVNNDTVKPDDIFTMGGTNSRIRIPSVMVSFNNRLPLRAQASQTATMRQKTVQPNQVDGDLDASIVFHEYGHGLTWRMIGGMSGALAGAIGEGAADTNAFMVLGRPIMGDYAFSNPAGIRRASYDGYARTYKDVTGAEVHDDGEIYAAAMWKVRQNYLAAGLTSADAHRDFVQGMNYTPSTPAFEHMRDGMLQAIAAAGTGRECLVWRGFAAQGIGVGAKGAVGRRGAVTITESFALPASCPP